MRSVAERRRTHHERVRIAAAFACLAAALWSILVPGTGAYCASVSLVCLCAAMSGSGMLSIRNIVLPFVALTAAVAGACELAVLVEIPIEFRTASGDVAGLVWATAMTETCVCALCCGACLVKSADLKAELPVLQEWSSGCSALLLALGTVPLIVNAVVYQTALSGLSYEAIHQAGLGPYRFVMRSGMVTEAALIVLLVQFRIARRRYRCLTLLLAAAYCGVFTVMFKMRSPTATIVLYLVYFFAHRLSLKGTIATAAVVFATLSGFAFYRDSDLYDAKGGVALATVDGLASFVDNVVFVRNNVASPAMGRTYIEGLLDPERKPGALYAAAHPSEYTEEGGGFGFFYVAELMWNFGIAGAYIAAGAVGWLMCSISTSKCVWARMFVLPAILGTVPAFVRNDFASCAKQPAYVGALAITIGAVCVPALCRMYRGSVSNGQKTRSN